jgi:hypothetical protein
MSVQPPSLESKPPRFGIKDPKNRGMQYMMVKMGKLVQNFENRFFRNKFPEEIVKKITSPKRDLNYHSNQTLLLECRVASSPRAWELDESHEIHLVVGGTSLRA